MRWRRKFAFMLALVLMATVAVSQTKTAQSGKPKVVQQDEFYVVGIEARTTTAKEASGQGIIGQLWQKFFQDGVLEKISNRADQNIYSVYTDFTENHAGEYSVVIGARVSDKSHVPAGMVVKILPAGKYLIYRSDKGPAAQVVAAAWQKIAEFEDKGQLGYTRTYKADYEEYGPEATDPQSLEADLHIGVK